MPLGFIVLCIEIFCHQASCCEEFKSVANISCKHCSTTEFINDVKQIWYFVLKGSAINISDILRV